MEVAGKNRTPGTWTFRYYVSNDVDTPPGFLKEICSKTFVIASPTEEQDYDGIWKDADNKMSFYVQNIYSRFGSCHRHTRFEHHLLVSGRFVRGWDCRVRLRWDRRLSRSYVQ